MTSTGKKSKIISTLQASLRKPKYRYSAIHRFRGGIPETEYFSTYRELFPFKKSLQDYHGPAFPKAAKLLFSNNVPKEPVNAVREILWAIARCLQFSEEIRDFLKIREQFEIAILRNKYFEVVNLLTEINDKFGSSIWLYQNRLAAAYISSNITEPAEVAKSLLDEVKSNNILYHLVHYIRRRVEGADLRDKIRSEFKEKIASSIYLSYFKAKIFDITNSSEDAVSSLLYIDSQASVIDHYESLIHTLQAAVSDDMLPDDSVPHIVSGLHMLYQKTEDIRLFSIVTVLGKLYDKKPDENAILRAVAIDSYTEGKYQTCIEVSKKILSNFPQDSAIRVIFIKASVAIDKRPTSEPGICGDINDNLYNILTASDQFFRSVHALFVMSDRFIDHSWMLYIRVSVHYEIDSEQNRRVQRWMRDIYIRDRYITPFSAYCLKSNFAEQIIFMLEQQGHYSATLDLVKKTMHCLDTQDETINSRMCRYIAREMLANGAYEAAANFYRKAAANEDRSAVRLRALGGASLALMLNGQYKSAVDTLIDAYLAFPDAPTMLPIKKLFEGLPDLDAWPNTICLGLLLSLAEQLDEGVDLSVQRLAFEKFCEDNKIATPTDLWKRSEEFGLNLVVEYLESVWLPEVMRQTLMYSSAEQIDEARIEACLVLVRINTKRVKIHQEELASRIKQQEISKATVLVEQSKVHVDIESIKRSLKTRLKTSYAQYKSSLSQHEKPQDEVVKKFQSIFSEIDGSASLSLILSQLHLISDREAPTQTDIQFSVIFGEITKEFLTGDHGLNAYLSTRVRHGKFVDALRKPVMDFHLVTARISDDIYVKNIFWFEKFCDDTSRDSLLKALEDFSRKFDNLLAYVRDKKIQIRTYIDLQSTDKTFEGLFLYHFSVLERRLVQYYDQDYKDFDELIGKCVDTLWEKTDANLIEVRNYLSGSLKSQLMDLFDNLSTRTAEVCNGLVPSELVNAIARSRTATQQALDSVVAWFKRNEVYDRKDFDIDFPPQIAASMVNRTMSMVTPWSGPKTSIQFSDSKLPGRSLDALVDIYYALFENAVKYAENEGTPLDVQLKLNYQKGEFVGEVISSAHPPTSDQLERLEQIRESLATPESRRLAQSEGRSGFRKIYIALDNPLYRSSSITFAHEINGQFRVVFSFRIADIQ